MTETIALTIVLTRATRKTKVGAKTRTNTTKRTIKTTELTNNNNNSLHLLLPVGVSVQEEQEPSIQEEFGNLDNEVGPITRKIKFYSIRLTE
ncbi:hypothetical protein Glove_410g90 [Diversispora epigaea]|uniref:Uncharacterized protein n=1 Tax=Diversispora epigaea TaxID=1348612 RepID=A0A397GYX8_9GLOM|nr:hypothetical protein Glove_410g90 [Diversispora epigaea]